MAHDFAGAPSTVVPSPLVGEGGGEGREKWQEIPLGDARVATLIMGQSPESSTYNEARIGLPFYQGKADFGLRNPIPTKWCSAPAKIAERGDVLLSVRAPVGDVNLAAERCCIGRGLAALRPGTGTESEFLFFMMMHEHDRLDGLGSGAIFNSINKDVLRTFALQIPPIPEQRKISACLSGLQRAIQIEVDRVRHLQELKAATMAKLFREGLRGEPLKETEIGQIPADWAVKRLGQVCDLQSGGTPDRTKLEYWGGGIPWVKTAEVNYRIIEKTSETISELGLDSSSAKVFPEGTVVMAMYGQGVTRGRVGILGIDAATNQACAALFPHPELNARFLYHWLAHNYHQIREFGHGANQKNLSLTILENLTISVPADLAEQAQIADALDLVNVQIQNAERESEVRKALFESMLQLLMTGQVRLSSELQIGGDK